MLTAVGIIVVVLGAVLWLGVSAPTPTAFGDTGATAPDGSRTGASATPPVPTSAGPAGASAPTPTSTRTPATASPVTSTPTGPVPRSTASPRVTPGTTGAPLSSTGPTASGTRATGTDPRNATKPAGTTAPSAPRPTARTTAPSPAASTAPSPARAGPAYAFPRTLLLPSVGVQAPVDPVSVADGALQVPDDPARVGWWIGGALPGAATGTTVIDGHIDSAQSGLGALWHLDRLAAGDPVRVVDGDGRTRDYRVVGRRVYVKDEGLPADLFARDGAHRLVLISCGGPFDEARKSYQDNVVVFAVPTA
ncbi:class F sortase [Nakamurella endophytica]|uniref:class F sortase n=1 Tax=Nakamurella endophytica TaxID=1748367 RepID=UPI00166D065C|nr:class F sortase [Nakamurella endophytica]